MEARVNPVPAALEDLIRTQADEKFKEAARCSKLSNRHKCYLEAIKILIQLNSAVTVDDCLNLSRYFYEAGKTTNKLKSRYDLFNRSGATLGTIPLSLAVAHFRSRAYEANNEGERLRNPHERIPFYTFALNCLYQIPEAQLTQDDTGDAKLMRLLQNFITNLGYDLIPKVEWVIQNKEENEESCVKSKPRRKSFSDSISAFVAFGEHLFKKKPKKEVEDKERLLPDPEVGESEDKMGTISMGGILVEEMFEEDKRKSSSRQAKR